MNIAQVSRLLGAFALFFTAVLAIPLVVALFEPGAGFDTVLGFGAAMVTGLLVGVLLRTGGRSASTDFFRREGLAVVGLAWLLAGGLGALPFVWSGTLGSAADGFFETVSGLTTTGASVFSTGGNPPIETLPASILLWRSMIQWIGGVGIILVFTVLLPAMGVTGKNLLASEAVGVADQSKRPRMQEQSRMLFRLYIVLTLGALLGFWATGMGPFDAMCHAFTTLATGGFSTRNASIGSYESLGVELVAILFMFLAGCNFVLLLTTVRERPFRALDLRRNPEFRAYLWLTLLVIVCLTATLWVWGQPMRDDSLDFTRHYSSLGRCLRDASFQAVSILTSTGFCTADFQDWPRPALFILIACMLIGGCTGSTAGGLKVLRLLVCTKLIAYSLHLFIRPRAVQKLKLGQEVIPNSVVSAILTLLLLWLASVGLGTLVLGLDPRLDPLSALSASASMMGCTGPAISEVLPGPDGTFDLVNQAHVNLGPYGGYGDLHPWTKMFLAGQMILGRLEILAPLCLLAPGFWRR